jgi:hypothetical protein
MQRINVPQPGAATVDSPWHPGRNVTVHQETAQFLARLDFRQASSHLSQRKPGYYLILLRTELRHRSLREKPALGE